MAHPRAAHQLPTQQHGRCSLGYGEAPPAALQKLWELCHARGVQGSACTGDSMGEMWEKQAQPSTLAQPTHGERHLPDTERLGKQIVERKREIRFTKGMARGQWACPFHTSG